MNSVGINRESITGLKLWFIRFLWMLMILLFFIIAFYIVPTFMREGAGIIDGVLPFCFIAGTTIFAWVLWEKHYPYIEHKNIDWKTLIYIPQCILYIILFEISFNYYSIFTDSEYTIMSHLQFHIFSDIIILSIIFFLMWLTFQKIVVSKKTFGIAYGLGFFFEFFFADGNGVGGAAIVSGLIWIWVLHLNWFITNFIINPGILFRKNKKSIL